MQTALIDLSNTYTYLCFLFVLSDKEAYWLSKALNKHLSLYLLFYTNTNLLCTLGQLVTPGCPFASASA